MTELSDFDRGFFVGLLVGEGSFGGDGRQPQVVLRMHTRHKAIFLWLQERFPNCRLYGPYHHSGRSYYQWMARGRALVQDVLPILDAELLAERDAHSAQRFDAMCDRYASVIDRERQRLREVAAAGEADNAAADGDAENAGAHGADDRTPNG